MYLFFTFGYGFISHDIQRVASGIHLVHDIFDGFLQTWVVLVDSVHPSGDTAHLHLAMWHTVGRREVAGTGPRLVVHGEMTGIVLKSNQLKN